MNRIKEFFIKISVSEKIFFFGITYLLFVVSIKNMVVLDFSSGAQKIIMLLAIGFIAYLILFTLFFVTRNSVVFLKKAYNRQQGGNINPAFYTSAALAGGVLLFSVFAKGFLEPPSLDAPRSLFEDLRWYDYMFWSAAMIFSFLYIVLKILERRVNAAN